MPKSTQEEKYRWIKPILDKEITIKQMSQVCLFSERSLKYWLANFRASGLEGLKNKSTRPKSQPNETPIRLKERIIELRWQTKLCAKKLNYKLKKEGIKIDDRTIGKIIKAEGLVRKYRVRKLKYKYIKIPLTKGELVEIDIKYVPDLVGEKQYYQFTAIDCASRWRYLKIYDNMGNSEATDFLQTVVAVANFRIRAIKTDNGSCFTNRYTGYLKSSDPLNPKIHAFDLICQKNNIIIMIAINKIKLKENILNALAVLFIVYGIFAMEYAVYRGKPEWVLWFCYVGLIIMGFGMLAKSSRIIVSQLNLLVIPLTIWLVDFFSRLFTGGHLFGTTKYFYDRDLLWPARLISLEHFFLVPLGILTIYLIRKKVSFAWVISIVEATGIYIFLKIFSSGEYNVSCIFESCFPYVPNDEWYPLRWFVIVFSMIFITQFMFLLFVKMLNKKYNEIESENYKNGKIG